MRMYSCLIPDLVADRRTILTWKYFLNLGCDLVVIVMVLLCLATFCIKVTVAHPGFFSRAGSDFFKAHIWILNFFN